MFVLTGPDATIRAPTGTSIRSILKAIRTNSITVSSKSVGTVTASRESSSTGSSARRRRFPQRSEFQEVEDATARQVDVASGYRYRSEADATYDVGGVLLPRPFKIARVGPVRLFVNEMEAALAFYRDRLGLTVTEEVSWNGHRCVFLRANTEHHSAALYPMALRDELGLSTNSSCMAFGMQVAEYSQLRDAVEFQKKNDVTVKFLPPELFPGIDYSAFAIDPDGHAIQLYYYMEQVGWDGRPRPVKQRPNVDNDNWPESLESQPDSYTGEAFMGPWG